MYQDVIITILAVGMLGWAAIDICGRWQIHRERKQSRCNVPPPEIEAYGNLRTLFEEAKFADVIKACDELLKNKPMNLIALKYKAHALVELGQRDEAREVIDKWLAHPDASSEKAEFMYGRLMP